MLLNEIFMRKKPAPLPKEHQGIPLVHTKRPPEDLGKKAMGAGTQSYIYGNEKSRPNSISKITRLERNLNDPSVDFTELAMQNQNNPFFPRISNPKILAYERSRFDRLFWLAMQQEKLQPMTGKKTQDAAAGMLQSLGFTDNDDFQKSMWEYGPDELLRGAFNDPAWRQKMIDSTNNPHFAEALQLLGPLFDKHKSDMKQDNFMLRMTQHGPQVVFIDPFWPPEDIIGS